MCFRTDCNFMLRVVAPNVYCHHRLRGAGRRHHAIILHGGYAAAHTPPSQLLIERLLAALLERPLIQVDEHTEAC